MNSKLLLGALALGMAGGALAATDYPSGYTKCAQVGSTCTMSGTHTVALGKSGSFVYTTLTGSFTCSTALFPSNSFTSSAWCSVGPTASASSSTSSSVASSSSSKSSSSAAASSKSSAAASSSSSSKASSSASSAATSAPASTATRPQLSAAVAANFTVAKYLGSWTPAAISTPSTPNYTVSSSGSYKTVQSAINAAINAGGSTRKYILVTAGTYNELVFVPSGPPITLYSTGAASSVKIQIATSALQSGSEYAAMVKASNYTSAGQSWVNSCAGKGSAIGTTCSAAFIIQNTGFEAKNLTITNSRVESGSGTDQAVAVYTVADQVHVDNVSMYGNQDTLWVDGAGKRFYAQNCYVEGDVDFIFGAGTGVFDNCQINYTAARGKNGSTIGAPSTQAGNYGFLFNGGSFTGSNGASNVSFARQWPQSSLSSPIGKMILRGVKIDAFINTTTPWKDWSSSNPVNYGTTSDPYLGEYLNTGAGAAK